MRKHIIIAGSIVAVALCSSLAWRATKLDHDKNKIVVLESIPARTSFRVPSFIKPVQHSMFDFYAEYPSGIILSQSESPSEKNVRILVAAVDKSAMRSNRPLESRYSFVGKQGEFTIYQARYEANTTSAAKTTETVWVKTDTPGYIVRISDPGSWSYRYDVHRPFSNSIELNYQFSKSIPVSEFTRIDAFVLQVVRTMHLSTPKNIQ